MANTKERDSSIGLDNHGFRYYDPEVGRYLTRDPIGYWGGFNVYVYVGNNPINFVDPLGLSAEGQAAGQAAKQAGDKVFEELLKRAVKQRAAGYVAKGGAKAAARTVVRGSRLLRGVTLVGCVIELLTMRGGDPKHWESIDFAEEGIRELERQGVKLSEEDEARLRSELRDYYLREKAQEKETSGTDPEAKKKGSLRKRMGEPPEGMKKPEAHHELPNKFRERFEEEGIDIDDPQHGRWVEGGPEGGHQRWTPQHLQEWEQFLDENPEASPEEIREKEHELREDPRFQE